MEDEATVAAVGGDGGSNLGQETRATVVDEPNQFDLVANRELAIGDEKVAEGTVLARLELPPGAPYSVRFITRSVEDLAIIPRPRE